MRMASQAKRASGRERQTQSIGAIRTKYAIRIEFCLIALILIGIAKLDAETVELLAVTTASPRQTGNDEDRDNRLRAYDRGDIEVYGWMKFDFSVVPDGSSVDAMELTLYAEGTFNSPFGAPAIQVWRTSFDTWVRAGTGFPLTFEEALTPIDFGSFPSVSGTPYTFSLDVSAVNWATDYTDDTLSLVLDESSPTNRDYMYWYGIAGSFTPKLSVTYTIPETTTLTLATLGLFLFAPRRKWWGRKRVKLFGP